MFNIKRKSMFKVEKSKKFRNESVLFNNGKKYNLLDEYDECDGGIIISIDDRFAILIDCDYCLL